MQCLPTISILMPTLNSGRVLDQCLASIKRQDYPQNKIEIIVADGGSIDETLMIAQKYGAKTYPNPSKTGEAGKAVALRHAKGELMALIDSDNILPNKNWLRQMVIPFSDPEILGSEPWEYTYRKKDNFLNRYFALLGMSDPLCFFFGNYDRKSVLSGRWTGLKMRQKDQGQYLKVKISPGILPTIGANGTIWRAKTLKEIADKSDYLFDTDTPYALARRKPFWFAKVKTGIVHLCCRGIKGFYKKQKRRASDFFYLEGKEARKNTFQRQTNKQFYFILSTISIFPLIIQSIRGYIKKRDSAWFFHPFACIITLWVYGTETIIAQFKRREMDRKKWKQ